jgi:hypothetical protein
MNEKKSVCSYKQKGFKQHDVDSLHNGG